jgi:DMSO reductase family type II enzyme heme b subunit
MIAKPAVVVVIAVVLVAAFAALLYRGALTVWGPPQDAAAVRDIVLEVPFLDRQIDLSRGISPEVWESLPATEIPLTYQITVLPWGQSLVSPLAVRAFHNDTHIYFHLSWADATEDRVQEFDRFPDASALMFPLGENPQPASIMMGFLGKVNIWHWKGSQDADHWLKTPLLARAYSDYYYPFEEQETLALHKSHAHTAGGAVTEIISTHIASLTEKQHSHATGRGAWDDSRWYVVFQNPVTATDPAEDMAFTPGTRTAIAFGIWDGAAGDRGSRKSISDWVTLEVKE